MHFKPKNFNSSIKWPVVSWLQKEQKLSCTYSIILIIIHKIYNEKADWSKAFNQYTIVCEVDMIKCNIWGLYCIYLLEINVCLVSKTLEFSVLNLSQTYRDAQNSWMPQNYNKTIISFSFWHHAQPHSIIAHYSAVMTMDRPWSSMFLPWLFTRLPVVQFCL